MQRRKGWAVEKPDHYPEIGGKVTMGRLILEYIARWSPENDLKNECDKFYEARFQSGDRTASVSTAAGERMFMLSLVSRGMHMATLDSRELVKVSQAIKLWLIDSTALSEVKDKIPSIVLGPQSVAIESGNAVEARWIYLLSANDSLLLRPELKPLILAASERPMLRQLFPVLSLCRFLAFSRTVGYPFKIVACASWEGNDNYRAFAEDRTVLKDGNIPDVLDAVQRSIGTGIGPAILGTADDLPK